MKTNMLSQEATFSYQKLYIKMSLGEVFVQNTAWFMPILAHFGGCTCATAPLAIQQVHVIYKKACIVSTQHFLQLRW